MSISSPPVLLIIFNRPTLAAQVIESLRTVRPSRLYIAADGPRNSRAGESELCQKTRELIHSIDWPCQVVTQFQTNNLGCRRAVTAAIDWFFENEEAGIILEDDVIASPSFFRYCAELLERYQLDERVFSISGCNFQRGNSRGEASYYFSKYTHVWGWATWRRSWALYDRDMHGWRKFKAELALGRLDDGVLGFQKYWTAILDRCAAKQIDTWDYQLNFSMWRYEMLSVIPNQNLTSNIGFGAGATHTKVRSHWTSSIAKTAIAFPLIHPKAIVRNHSADQFVELNAFGVHWRWIIETARNVRKRTRVALKNDINL